jgi:TadE-like protein
MQTHTEKIWSKLNRADGQAFVEFVIVLPLLVLLVFGIIQFGLAFHNYLAITDGARVAARAAAVKRGPDACVAAKTAFENAAPNQASKFAFPADWCIAGPNVGDQVKITIKYPYTIGLPGVSATGDLTSSATERLE